MSAAGSQATFRLPTGTGEHVELFLRRTTTTVEMQVVGTPTLDLHKTLLDHAMQFTRTPGIAAVDKIVISVPLSGTYASGRWIEFLLGNGFKTQITPDAMIVDEGTQLVDLEKSI